MVEGFLIFPSAKANAPALRISNPLRTENLLTRLNTVRKKKGCLTCNKRNKACADSAALRLKDLLATCNSSP